MCHFSNAPSMRGGRSTRASHKSRPRRLPPPRTDTRLNPVGARDTSSDGVTADRRDSRAHNPPFAFAATHAASGTGSWKRRTGVTQPAPAHRSPCARGYPPKSPSQPGPNSGLGHRNLPQIDHFRGTGGERAPAHQTQTWRLWSQPWARSSNPCTPLYFRNRSVVGALGRDSCLLQRILRAWSVWRRRRSMTLAARLVCSSFLISLRVCSSWRSG